MDVVTYVLSKNWAKKYTDEQISAIAKGMNYRGSVVSSADLPVSGNVRGDVYTASDTHTEYVWPKDESSGEVADWEPLGSGSLVYSNNIYQETWNADTKLDLKVIDEELFESVDMLPMITVDRNDNLIQSEVGIATSAEPDCVVQRTNTGQVRVPEVPTNRKDAASKKYVDDSLPQVVRLG